MLGGLTTAIAGCGTEELAGPDPAALPEPNDTPTEDPVETQLPDEPDDTLDENETDQTPSDPEVPQEPLLPEPGALSEADVFGIGVSAGDARPEHIVLSTRYDSTEPLVAALWRQDPDGLTPISITDVSPEDGGFVRVELELPTPDTYYLYAFCQKLDQELVSRSPIGRFLAPPAHDTLRPVRMGASCCAYNLLPPLTLGHAAQRDDLEFFCFLGDTSYNDGCYTIEQYRESWASNLGKRQFIELRQSTSIIATWDDHEIANDWDPESVTLEQYQTAHQAFTEAIPMLRSE